LFSYDLAAMALQLASTISDMLQLWCWVEGDDHKHTFPIEIMGSKTVSELKDAIKKKKEHTFQEVDADTLMLWKVSMSCSLPKAYH
jgi:hypothetical protein